MREVVHQLKPPEHAWAGQWRNGQPRRVVEPLNPPLPSNRLNAQEKPSLVKEHALPPLYEGITEQRAPVFDRTV
jgi:hypothetical protein